MIGLERLNQVQDKRRKLLIVEYAPTTESIVSVKYPQVPPQFELDVDAKFNEEKDTAILVAAISGLIKKHEADGGNGGRLLKRIVRQLEDAFMDDTLEVINKKAEPFYE